MTIPLKVRVIDYCSEKSRLILKPLLAEALPSWESSQDLLTDTVGMTAIENAEQLTDHSQIE
uniref:Uncharacterized protein n=1 Tax=Romanomermis culicivorax TaxID=13658 RepID=A0A915KY82_ROMCU